MHGPLQGNDEKNKPASSSSQQPAISIVKENNDSSLDILQKTPSLTFVREEEEEIEESPPDSHNHHQNNHQSNQEPFQQLRSYTSDDQLVLPPHLSRLLGFEHSKKIRLIGNEPAIRFDSYFDLNKKAEEEKMLKPKKASKMRIFLATACFSGLQFGWALQLGLSKDLITLIWLCGPVSGLIIQPIVGILSDRCKSPLGKRRPFLIVGTIMIVLSLLLIPFSLDLGHAMGDPIGDHPIAITLAIIGFWILDVSNNTLQGPTRALVADMASSKNQAFGNAALTFWSGLGNILGYLAGFIRWAEYIPIFKTEVCSEGCQNLKICFLQSIMFLLFTFVITLLAAKEEPTHKAAQQNDEENRLIKEEEEDADHTRSEVVESNLSKSRSEPLLHTSAHLIEEIEQPSPEVHSHRNANLLEPLIDNNNEESYELSLNHPQQVEVEGEVVLEHNIEKEKEEHTIFPPDTRTISLSIVRVSQMWNYVKTCFSLPKAMWRVCFVTFFSYLGWFTFLVYITTWVGENVFHGKSDDKEPSYSLYVKGVQFGSFGLAGFAGSSIIFSLIVPVLCQKIGFKATFFISQLVLAGCLGATLFVTNKILALLLISTFGFPWAVSNTIPFALVATIANKDQKGTYMGLLNIFIVIPQLVMSSFGPLVSYLSKGNVAWTLMCGAISVLISAVMVWFLIIPPSIMITKKKKKNRLFISQSVH